MRWLQLSCIVFIPAAGVVAPVRICDQAVLISFSTAPALGTPTIIVEYASSSVKYSVPGGYCFRNDALVATDLRIGVSPPKGTTGPDWNSSDVDHFMNSHSASLLAE